MQAASDYRLCKWPLPLDDMNDGCLARYFDELNREEFQREVAKDQEDCQIITFSHFLPRYSFITHCCQFIVSHFESLI